MMQEAMHARAKLRKEDGMGLGLLGLLVCGIFIYMQHNRIGDLERRVAQLERERR